MEGSYTNFCFGTINPQGPRRRILFSRVARKRYFPLGRHVGHLEELTKWTISLHERVAQQRVAIALDRTQRCA
jgi:hypothetical protein